MSSRPRRALGRHLLVELYGCDRKTISDPDAVRKAMLAAAKACRATVVAHVFREFKPHGVSGMVVISESHMAVHTWPEHDFASVDVFTCGRKVRPEKALPVLKRRLGSSRMTALELQRGMLLG
ncbi:adenosylmethionine decarboxylase [Elusimicrobiota bacterium]